MAAAMETAMEEFLSEKDYFRRNAFWIIYEMVMTPRCPSVLVDEILHSIFFLGEISEPKYKPKDIVTDDDMMNILKGRYPEPFKRYSSQLPRRSPISCVLDMIVSVTGQEKEEDIKSNLQRLNVKLKQNDAKELISSTACVSQRDKTSKSGRHYGVSMSTSGRDPRRVVIAASCLSTWDSYVAGAVMTYYPSTKKKPYFDGTIKLPEYVRCEAFNITEKTPMHPCRSCRNMFGLQTSETQVWPYGNCAEAESVSNLLKNEKAVREEAKPRSPTCTDANRQKAEKDLRRELTDCLTRLKFTWDTNFYTPRGV